MKVKNTMYKNRYILMRHGRSLANEQGVVVSSIENGGKAFGLIEEGRNQVDDSIRNAITANLFDKNVKILCSSFLRTKETAEVAISVMKEIWGEIKIDITYRDEIWERGFGKFEMSSAENYGLIHKIENEDKEVEKYGIETAESVMNRVGELILELESKFEGETFLIVSHGDTLLILECWFRKWGANKYKELPYIQNAEIREMKDFN